MVGQTVSHYHILGKLGGGGMGVVYEAEDRRLPRKVALKFLSPDYVADHTALERLKREAYAASALNHPNICTIHDIGEHESQPFIVMELLEGDTLRQLILPGKPLPLDQILDFAVQIADALNTAHLKGVVHRDIKPANLIVTRHGQIKILDFGLAKLAPKREVVAEGAVTRTLAATEELLTSPGSAMGTIAYMSPEQARGEDLDARTDLFSFGTVLYEMATGQQAFAGNTPAVIFEAILNRDPVPATQLNPDVPLELEQMIAKSLEKDRDLRYQTAGELRGDLKRLRRDTQSGRVSRIPAVTPKKPAWLKAAVYGATVLATLAIVAALLLFLFKPASKPLGVVRLTNSGNVELAAISPDGKYLAYVVNESQKQSLWIQQVSTATNSQLLPPAKAAYGFIRFSPDNDYILYTRAESNMPRALYQMAVFGGTPRKLLADVPRRVAISPDGKQFARLKYDQQREEAALLVAAVDGTGERKILAAPEASFWLHDPAWSPEGKLLAVVKGSPATAFREDLVVVSVAGGLAQKITSEPWLHIDTPEWLPDGSGLIAAASGTHGQLWEFPYPSGQASRITHDLFRYGQVSLTADSRQLVTVQEDSLASVWVGPATDPDRARPVTPRGGHFVGNFGLAWVPDGRIIYWTNATDRLDFMIIGADGSNPRALPLGTYKWTPEVCPDGQTLIYAGIHDAQYRVLRSDLDGSNPQPLSQDGAAWEPQCSPDGKWVVYRSLDGPGLWKVPLGGGKPIQLSNKDCSGPSVSPDGKWVVCVSSDQNGAKFAVIPFEGGEPAKFFALPATYDGDCCPLRWTPDGRGITYPDRRGDVGNLYVQPVSGRPPHPLTHFVSEGIGWFAWSHDGKQLAIARGTGSRDAVMITSFR